jgi:hypothetical protein
MKTSNYKSNLIRISEKANILYVIIIVLLNLSHLNAQQIERMPYRFGAGIGTHISGNAHGNIYDVYGSLYNGKNLISFGPCIQNNSNPLSGARISFSHMLTGQDDLSKNSITNFEDDKLQLFVFSFCQYLHNAHLSSGAIKQEQLMSRGNEHQLDYNSIKLSTIELGVGFGLNLKLSKKMVWGNYIGISTIYHTNYINGLHTDKIAPVLVVGTSFGFNFL